MLIALMTSLNERRREMAILRSVGARPFHVLSLIVGESALLTIMGVLIGIGLLYGLLIAGQPLILYKFGIFIEIGAISLYELWLIVSICVATTLPCRACHPSA